MKILKFKYDKNWTKSLSLCNFHLRFLAHMISLDVVDNNEGGGSAGIDLCVVCIIRLVYNCVNHSDLIFTDY